MRKRSGGRRREQPRHDHDWEPVDCAALDFDDCTAIVSQSCEFVEILDQTISEQRDEVFYREGRECEATRETRLPAATLEWPDGVEVELPDIEEMADRQYEKVEELSQAASRGAVDDIVLVDAGSQDIDRLEVHHDGWTLTYERAVDC